MFQKLFKKKLVPILEMAVFDHSWNKHSQGTEGVNRQKQQAKLSRLLYEKIVDKKWFCILGDVSTY